MPVENANRAVIDEEKLLGYLLSETHPVGRYKAAFFSSLGYSAADWERLRTDLREHVLKLDPDRERETQYGRKYEFHASLNGPNGRSAQVVSVWMVHSQEDFPRFITAYPGTKS